MIKSFRCKETEKLFNRGRIRKFQSIERTARRKLEMVNAAKELRDLAQPPNNKLEALKKDRAGQHAIRINDQWRVCFVWRHDNAYDVEVVEYH